MADVMTREQRSRTMAGIRGRDTLPERQLRSELWKRGMRFRLHLRTLPGRPDIVLPRARLAIFVDGCFWHCCPTHMTWPSTNSRFWREKIEANVRHAGNVNESLSRKGWTVYRVWEHRIRSSPRQVAAEIDRLRIAKRAMASQRS